ncbi:MAG: S1 RNA-binding domain-containing protein, partial [Bacteroidales bacterium]|nr:S1 RNA-binding domain-containing protein [Bacteroidales bacterium]
FMSDKIGQHFQGVITGVTSFGLFVELNETKCEGLVAIRDLDDDYYEFDEDNYCLVGRQTDRKFQLGDELLVEVWRTNLPKKQLDFRLIDENGDSAAMARPTNQNRSQKPGGSKRKSNPDKTRKTKGVQRKRR